LEQFHFEIAPKRRCAVGPLPKPGRAEFFRFFSSPEYAMGKAVFRMLAKKAVVLELTPCP
jgi:hypothetical protein